MGKKNNKSKNTPPKVYPIPTVIAYNEAVRRTILVVNAAVADIAETLPNPLLSSAKVSMRSQPIKR